MRNRLLVIAAGSLALSACVGDPLVLPPATCTTCGDTCVDVQTDSAHCGSCDKACAAGEVCRLGQCALNCPDYLVACDGKCVDPQTNSGHCGAKLDCAAENAGEACAENQVCAAGSCLSGCPSNFVSCGGTCIDPKTSRTHCGATAGCADAGDACEEGEVCNAGICETSCPPGQLACAGKCVTPASDPDHCGAKGSCVGTDAAATDFAGVDCPKGQSCNGGVCEVVCAEGQLVCEGRCIDPATDAAHCGAKGACSSDASDSADFAGVACGPCEVCGESACQPRQQQIVIPVEADSYVDTVSPDAVHGAEQEFVVDRGNKRAFLRFDLSAIPAGARILSASLHAFVYTGFAYGGDGEPRFRFVEDDSWDEAMLTSNNAPVAATESIGTFGLVWFDNGINEYPVQTAGVGMVPVVQREVEGDRRVSLELRCGGYRTNYRSKEYGDGSKVATLVVTYSLGAPPSSCEAMARCAPATADGDYRLFLGGSASAPYAAWCGDMATGAKTFLPLVNVGGDFNFSQYTAGGARPGTTVRTNYSRIRFDPSTRLVNIGDQTHATSVGSIEESGYLVTSMPFGTAASCDSAASGLANVNLVGTPFKVVNAWTLGGNAALGEATMSENGQVWDVTGGGNCGWNNPGEAIYQPYNYADAWWNLELEYVP